MLFKVYQCGVDSYHGKEFSHELHNGFDCWNLVCAITPQRMNCGNKLLDVPAGTCILYPAGYPRYLYCATGAEFFVNTWIHFSVDSEHAFDQMLVRYGITTAEFFRIPKGCAFTDTMKDMVYEYSTTHANSDEMISALMNIAFIQLGRDMIPFGEQEKTVDPNRRRAFETLRKELYSSPEKSWSSAEMAAKVYLSVNHLIILYKFFFNVTPKQDLLDARIVKAQALLGSSSVISEVARNCGFENEYYFSRVFKKKTGMTPSEYAQKRIAEQLPAMEF